MVKKRSFIKTIFYAYLGIFLLLVCLTGLYLAEKENKRINEMGAVFRSTYVQSQKKLIQEQVLQRIGYATFQQERARRRFEIDIKERVYSAWDICNNMYTNYHGKLPENEVKRLIVEALRPIRYNGGKGYFFAFSMDGTYELYAVIPEREGSTIRDVQDSHGKYIAREMIEICRSQGEGYLEYTWIKPGQEDAFFPKIAFVKYFKPLDIFIGTGIYLDDIQTDIQEETLERIESIRFGNDGYFFVCDYDGIFISHPQKEVLHKKIESFDDPHIRDVFTRIIAEGRKPEGGFITYDWIKPSTGKLTPKLTYARPFPEWKWIIATGVYLDDIEGVIQARLDEDKRILRSQIIFITGVSIFFILLSILMNWGLSSKLRNATNAFMDFFRQASSTYEKIDLEQLSFSEFDTIGGYANKMADDIKVIQDGLKKSEKRFRSIFENAVEGIFQVSMEGRFLMINQSMADILGYDSAEQAMAEIEDTQQIYYNPKDRDKIQENIFKTGEIRNWECAFKRRTGDPCIGLVNITLIRDEDGNPAYLEGSGVDITQRIKAESDLRKREYQLSLIINSFPGWIARLDCDLRYIYMNNQYARIYQLMPENTLGQSFAGIMGENIYQEELPYLKRALNGETVTTETRVAAKEDKYIYGLNNYIPDIGPDGTVNGIFIIVLDITGRKDAEEKQHKLEEQLMHSQKMDAIGQLAGGIAHDFNNILTGIQGNASLLLMQLTSEHPHYQRLKHIEEQVERGAKLTKQLLGFARGGKYEIKTISINDLIKKSTGLFTETKKEIEAVFSLQEDLRPVEADEGQIEQVLLNLYINAGHAMPGGGTLYIETSNVTLGEKDALASELSAGDYIKISVTDTGTGMDQATLKRIFEPFFSTKTEQGGTGLGLASAYGIIRNHGGMIHAYSEPGKGATFIIYLPSSQQEQDDAEDAQAKKAKLYRGTGCILVVDDEAMILNTATEVLSMLGYTVLKAANGQEAFDLYSQNHDRIDLVLLDMILPGMSGAQVLKGLQEINPEVKVILASGYGLQGEVRKVMDMGCRGFIQKPYNFKELSAKVYTVLQGTQENPD